MNMTDVKNELKVEKSPQFKVEYVDGLSGGINQEKDIAWIQFFTDNPNVKYDAIGNIASTEIVRTIVIDVRMSVKTFEAMSKFMEMQLKTYEGSKKGIGKTK